MDHFNVSQTCVYCLRGKKSFRVDLKLYDDNGRLLPGIEKMQAYRFICHFCWRLTTLDFNRFSHPDLICHLKSLHQKYEETKEALDRLYILFQNIKKCSI